MKYLDTLTNKEETLLEVANATISSSYRMTQGKLTKEEARKIGIFVEGGDDKKRKYYGVNCSNWFTQAEFNKRFKIVP
jgi:hypothetical protein